jgi:hypothetical protein
VTARKRTEEIEMDRRRQPLQAGCLVLAGVLLAGCSPSAGAAQSEPDVQAQPARVVHMPGTGRSQVVLTADAAKRVGLRTESTAATAAARSAGRSGKSAIPAASTVIPLAAVLYDKDGKSWVYTVARPLTFVPVQVVITHVDGESATISSGPAAGTQVVTVGGAELLGAEYGVPGEQ